MEVLQKKTHDDADQYTGVIAYGKAKNGNAYVLKVLPENEDSRWFVICQAEQTNISEIFEESDEMGEGLVFDYYDEAIEGFTEHLNK